MGNVNQKVSQWQTCHRNCYPSYCRNWDPGFFQDSHVLYDAQASEQKLHLPNKCRKEFPTMPNKVSTVKWPVQNDSLASISYKVAVIWVGAEEPYVLWKFQLLSKYDPKIASNKKYCWGKYKEVTMSYYVVITLCSVHWLVQNDETLVPGEKLKWYISIYSTHTHTHKIKTYQTVQCNFYLIFQSSWIFLAIENRNRWQTN